MNRTEFTRIFKTMSASEREEIHEKIISLLHRRSSMDEQKPLVCPICGMKDPVLIKKGKSNGKQRYLHKDSSCKRKFTYDTNSFTSWMRIPEEEFIVIVEDTLNGVPEKETAYKIQRSMACVVNNRHRFWDALEEIFPQEERKKMSDEEHSTMEA